MNVRELGFHLITRSYQWLFARAWCYPWNKLLFNLSLRGIGILNKPRPGELISRGEWNLLRRLARQWKGQPVVLDVGAHHGDYAVLVKQVCPGARVYAFEPNPHSFAVLRRKAEERDFVAINQGCSGQPGRATLYDYAGAAGTPVASLHEEAITTQWRAPSSSMEVTLVALDDFLHAQQIRRVDLLKIDTEGHDLRVLEGLRVTLAGGAIDMIQFEFGELNVFSRAFARDFFAALPDFDFYRLLPDRPVRLGEYRPVLWEIFAYQNIVAVRRGSGITL